MHPQHEWHNESETLNMRPLLLYIYLKQISEIMLVVDRQSNVSSNSSNINLNISLKLSESNCESDENQGFLSNNKKAVAIFLLGIRVCNHILIKGDV